MFVAKKLSPARRVVYLVSTVALVCGAGGMAASCLFLRSMHPLDALAGASGFLAGSVLVAAGLLSLASIEAALVAERTEEAPAEAAPAFATPAFVTKWLAHFHRNQQNRPEPAWDAPVALAPDVLKPLLRSIEQFQLGDGGGPASLIAWNAATFRASQPVRQLVDLWFAEEREHSRLLKGAVARFGGQCIEGHWSFTAFCLSRRWLGVQFELTILLLTEIASTVYYRLIRRHAGDKALRGVCRLILRDEAGHVAFHRDRLANDARAAGARFGLFWRSQFRALGFIAATVLWISHARALKAIGATRGEFYANLWAELSRFLKRLDASLFSQRRLDRLQ
jgi:hypothetical protein